MSSTENKEKHAFQTEVRQLLDLMIHSLYSNKEIFLRELISNASDAADKLRFEALSNDALYAGNANLEIRIGFDKEAGTVTIADTGLGMTRPEVVSNIGTIAKSGTKEFLKSLSGEQVKDANLIGQFGVGFYSAFIVADRVTLTTRKAGEPAESGTRWESTGDGEYTLESFTKADRGTEVTLHLKAEEKEFLDDWRLRSIIRKFSDHVSWPILMEATQDLPEEGEEGDTEDGEKGEEKQKKPKEAKWETVNKASALWTRPKSDIKDSEYTEFYKHVAHDFDEPLAHIHAQLEGKQEYSLLLYIPKNAPFDLWDRDRKHRVKLYVRRVFIMEGAEELIPRYFRFISGVIDSADLPLNISREILQKNRQVEAIKKGATGKIFSLLENLAKKEPEKYQTLWKAFGKVLKEGIIEDFVNKDRLAKLLRFATTHTGSETQDVSLADYVARMKEGQDTLYFVSGETHSAARHSPHLEIFTKQGIEVILLSDRVDEWLVSHLTEFDGKKLQSVTQGDLDLSKLEDAESKKEREQKKGDFKSLLERVQESLGDLVKEVRITQRLTDSPSCLVGDTHDMSSTMERILKEAGQSVPVTKRILELNPNHPLLVRLKEESDKKRFGDLSRILHDQALLNEGGQLEDPSDFVRRINTLLLEMVGR